MNIKEIITEIKQSEISKDKIKLIEDIKYIENDDENNYSISILLNHTNNNIEIAYNDTEYYKSVIYFTIKNKELFNKINNDTSFIRELHTNNIYNVSIIKFSKARIDINRENGIIATEIKNGGI